MQESGVLRLNADQRALLGGELGAAAQLAMRLIARMAEVNGARDLISISRAHVDGCLYHGQASVDLARTLAEGGGQVRVPTTLNVGIIDLLHPELFRGKPEVAAAGREMMKHYRAMGCSQTWTCAPYQLADRPILGEQIAWAESNAIVFANSVLGARTERYGDFMDIAAAITGYVPYVGLHTSEGRRARVVVRVRDIPAHLMTRDVFSATLGHFLGLNVGAAIPVIVGVDALPEEHLKALGAAAASAGAVAMFHMVGVTPEAPTLDAALGGHAPHRTVEFGPAELSAAMAQLSSTDTKQLGAVSVGTPHFSVREFEQLRGLLRGRTVDERVEFFVSTGQVDQKVNSAKSWEGRLCRFAVHIVFQGLGFGAILYALNVHSLWPVGAWLVLGLPLEFWFVRRRFWRSKARKL